MALTDDQVTNMAFSNWGKSVPSSSSSPGGQGMGSAGIGLQFGAGIGQAYADWQSGKTNQMIDNFNASVETQKAAAEVNQGQFQSNQLGQRLGATLAGQATGFGAHGVVTGAGTSADVAKSTANVGLADMAMIRTNAAMRAWGYSQMATADQLKGTLAAQGGKSAAIGAGISALAGAAGGMYRLSN